VLCVRSGYGGVRRWTGAGVVHLGAEPTLELQRTQYARIVAFMPSTSWESAVPANSEQYTR
jgi:hypothetical protein